MKHLSEMSAFTRPLALFVCFLFLTGGLTAEKAKVPPAQLKAGDIEHLLETYPKMVSQLKALGKKYENLNNPTALQAALANQEVQAVLARYDWTTEGFLSKLTTIASAYGSAMMQAELAKMPAEQRAMMESMMGGQMPDLMTVHPDDMALVQKHMAKLRVFFDSQ